MDYSPHFIKEEADTPQEDTQVGQGHIVSHLFAQNHVGTERVPDYP